MKLPSRKTITATIFFAFFLIFFGFIFWYFIWPFLNLDSSEYNDTNPERRPFSFFPFGRGDSQNTAVNTENPGEQTNQIDNEQGPTTTTDNEDGNQNSLPRFRQITFVPTAGAVTLKETIKDNSIFEQNKTPRTIIRYMEAETGHVYDTFAETPLYERIANTTIPRVQEALWIDSDSVIVRYDDSSNATLRTFSANLTPRDASSSTVESNAFRLAGTFLPNNIRSISINKTGELVYTSVSDGRFSLIKTDSFGEEKTALYSSPITEWKPDWSGRTEKLTLTQYPSAVSYGISLEIDPETQISRPFVSGRRGLDVLMSPGGERSLVSYKTDEGISLFIRDADGTLRYTGFETFAEKCVWSSDSIFVFCAVPTERISANSPDDWYQGVESYSDDFVRIKTDDNTSRELFSPFAEGGYILDAVEPRLSNDERFLYFLDKQDRFLWMYTLEL